MCKEKGTTQVNLLNHMKQLWQTINFDPDVFEIDGVEYDNNDEGADTTANFVSNYCVTCKLS